MAASMARGSRGPSRRFLKTNCWWTTALSTPRFTAWRGAAWSSHKVFLAESAQGLITDYQVLDGNPADTTQVQASLQRHQQIFQCAPDLYAGDRGFYSAENLDECQRAGVSQASIPQRGGQKTAEREALESSKAFKKGQRFRVGIEGTISVLFRGRGMKRCRAEGRQRFEVLVGAAVLANNLLRIAKLLKDKKAARRPKAA